MRKLKRFPLFFMACVVLAGASAEAQNQDRVGVEKQQPKARMQVYPTTIYLKPGQASAEVNVINRGLATGRYRMTIADMKMEEEGALRRQEEGAFLPFSLGPHLRATPRAVTVPPGQSQKFRLLARLPRDMGPGEYITHVHIVLTSDNVESEGRPVVGDGGFNVGTKAHLRVSIPVKLVIGDPSYNTNLVDVSVERSSDPKKKPQATFTFNHSGDYAARGVLKAFLDKGGESHQVLDVDGYTIYRNTPVRRVHYGLEMPEGVSLQGGTLRVVYERMPEDGGAVITQKSIQL